MFKILRGDVSKLEVQWSPVHKNKFITWGPDIRMYEVINSAISENSKNNDTPKGFITIYIYLNTILYININYYFTFKLYY